MFLEEMENTDLEQNQNQEEQEEQQPIDTVDNADSANQDGNGTDTTVNPPANLEEWQKDGRYGKMWNKPDDVYKSYTSLEKNFNDINPKYKNLLNILKENGFKSETLADELKKFADYRNPQSNINQLVSFMEKWMTNDLYSPRVIKFFNELEAEELQRLYPNMSAEQIAKQQAMDKELQQLKQEQAQRNEEMAVKQIESEIAKGVESCEQLAKEYGFKLTDDVKNYLYDYCSKNNIAPQHMEFAFRKIYSKQLLEARDKKIITNYSARKQKIKDAQIVSGGSSKVGNFAPTGDAKSKLKATFERILGKQ